MISKIIPRDSKRREAAKKAAGLLGILPKKGNYSEWVAEQKDKIPLYAKTKLAEKPLISIVVPAFNTPKQYLLPLVYSIVAQTYPDWELIIVNASDDKKSKKLINDCPNIDSRIKVFEIDNKGISENTNLGIKKAEGKYIGFIDHDDTIEPNAIEETVRAINKNPDAGLIYTDEDKLSEDGKKYLNPHCKPDLSPDLLTHVNYITHFTLVNKDLIESVGMLDSKKDGAQDYDLVLKIADTGAKIVHVPEILYHWREAKNSTAAEIQNKKYIFNSGEAALKDHYRRQGLKVHIKAIENKPGFYKTVIEPKKSPTIIFTMFSNQALVAKYLKILEKRGLLKDQKIILPENLRMNNIKATYIDDHKSYLLNALEASGDYALIINDFVFPDSKNWLNEITGLLEQDHVHAVAPIIVRLDNYVDDAGIVTNETDKYHIFKGYKFGINTYFGDTDWTRNVDELSGNVMAVRKKEIIDFIKDEQTSTRTRKLLNNFSKKTNGKYNVILSTTPMKHVRTGQNKGESRFMNPSLTIEGSDLNFYPNDKQILDALELMEKIYG